MKNKWDKPRRIIDKLDESKISELFSLSTQMNTFTLKQFSNINKIPLTVSKKDGNNLVHEIVSSDDETKSEDLRLIVIKFLVDEGVSPDSPNSDNNTPLHFACTKQYYKIIKYLLENGSNTNYKDNVGMTPFHYLLAGDMKLCPPSRQVKDFIPLNKKTNKHKIDNLKDIKMNIWERIKDDPILESLKNTITDTELPPLINKYLADFQNNLTKILKDDDKDDLQQLKELVEPFKTELRNWITKQFGDFKKIDNFEIHPIKSDSYTNIPRSKTATIKNHDSIKNVKNKIISAAEKIENIDLDKIFDENPEFEIENMYRIIIDTLNQAGGGNKLITDNFLFDYTIEFDDTTKKTTKLQIEKIKEETFNLIRHPLAQTDDDNIINWKMGTFVGGNRMLTIQNVKLDDIKKSLIQDKIENIIDSVFSLELDNYTNFKDDDILNFKNDIFEIINENTNDPIFFYNYIINEIKDKEGNINKINDLTLYFIAGLANYTTNLELSIFNASKLRFLDEIISDTDNQFYLWIEFLLSSQIKSVDELKVKYNKDKLKKIDPKLFENEQLRSLIILSHRIFRKKKIDLKNEMFNWIPSIENNKLPITELLINGLVNYYDRMDQKPLKQHLVFTINILRSYEQLRKSLNDSGETLLYINRKLSSLNPNKILTINNDDEFLEYEKTNNDVYDDFEKEFENDDDDDKINLDNLYELSRITPPSIINIPDQDKNKFKESYCLGLIYIGKIEDEDEDEDEIITKYKGKNIKTDISAVKNEIINKSTIYSYINLMIYNIEYYEEQRILVLEKLQEIMKNLPKGSKNYAKIIPVYLTSLNSLTLNINYLVNVLKQEEENFELNDLTVEIYNSYDFISITKEGQIKINLKTDEKFLNTITTNLNKINGYYYIYYYMKKKNLTEDGEIKIPQFFYNLLPTNIIKREIVYYEDEDTPMINLEGGSRRIGNFNYNISSSYDDLLNRVRSGDNFVMEHKINDGLRRNRKDSLPPAVLPLYSDFYKYNLIDLAKTLDNEKLIKNIDINLKIPNMDIANEHLKHLLVEELISEYLKHFIEFYIQKSYRNIISGVRLGNNDSENFDDELKMINVINEFSESINFNKIDNSFRYLEELYDNNTNKILLNFYKTSDTPDKKEEFKIYPNDYTNTNLLKSFYCLNVNNEAIKIMLDYYAQYNLKDIDNNTPVHLLLKNYYSNPLKEMKKLDLDFGSKIKRFNMNIPLHFMINEYNNHIKKINNGKNKIKDIVEFFTINQYKEIENMIYANDDFGNNIIRNLKLSYSINISILQRFLTFNMIFEIDKFQKNIEIKNKVQSNKFNVTDLVNFIKSNIKDKNIFLSDKMLISNEILQDTTKEINDLNSKIIENNKLIKKNIFKNVTDKLTNENKNLKEKSDNLLNNNLKLTLFSNNDKNEKINSLAESFSLDLSKNNYDIISDLNNNLLKNNKIFNQNHGSYINSYKIFIHNDEFQNSENNLLLKLTNNEMLISEFILKNEIKIENTEIFFKKNNELYNILSKKPLEYFEGSKYTNNNETRKFCHDLLIHLTQNIICFDLEMIIRKILYQNFQQKYLESNGQDIVRKIDHVLKSENKDFKEGKTILDILYQVVAPKLVKNSINFFKDKYDKQTFNLESTKEILENFFELFTITEPIKINKQDYVFKIFNNEIINYFDTITSKIIINWLVVIENQFKFIINQKRILNCIVEML